MLDWTDQLIQEYTDGKRLLRSKADGVDRDDPERMEDLKQINSMIDSMTYSLEWMTTGRQPGMYRGVESRSIYQRRSYENIDLIPDIEKELREENDINRKQLYMTKEEKAAMADILVSFSLRERQCYILHTAQGMSMAEIAEELGVSKSSVQMYINRAKDKVTDRVG